MQDVATIRAKFEALRPYLDERRRRLWAAAEALAVGRGGMTAVATATGLQRATIRVGVRELQGGPSTSTEQQSVAEAAQRVRAPGGGRKPLTTEDPTLVHDLEALVEPTTRGGRPSWAHRVVWCWSTWTRPVPRWRRIMCHSRRLPK